VFKINISLEKVKEKYFSDHSGIQALGYFALYYGLPVAFMGSIPEFVKFRDHVELTAQYCDAMTLKDHRSRSFVPNLGTSSKGKCNFVSIFQLLDC
jgi:hypothetical protein